jgi:predicted nucleotidyltransferase component of viral defense system
MFNERQIVEIFHLQFLRAFSARVEKSLFSLKGGCNLRFYFRSIRYSEDMDIDIHTMSVPTLRNNVDRVLSGVALISALRSGGIQISQASAPKQTETTQRWKIALRAQGVGFDIPTKIEFSRRGISGETATEPVDGQFLRSYRLYPVITQHYSLQSAFAQKVTALALREQIQSRDVFDLKLLMEAGASVQALPASVTALLPTAIDHAMAVTADDFVGQVVSYLDPEYQVHYTQPAVWAKLQDEVIDTLQAVRS